jgi:hypothetical protein
MCNMLSIVGNPPIGAKMRELSLRAVAGVMMVIFVLTIWTQLGLLAAAAFGPAKLDSPAVQGHTSTAPAERSLSVRSLEPVY